MVVLNLTTSVFIEEDYLCGHKQLCKELNSLTISPKRRVKLKQ